MHGVLHRPTLCVKQPAVMVAVHEFSFRKSAVVNVFIVVIIDVVEQKAD